MGWTRKVEIRVSAALVTLSDMQVEQAKQSLTGNVWAERNRIRCIRRELSRAEESRSDKYALRSCARYCTKSVRHTTFDLVRSNIEIGSRPFSKASDELNLSQLIVTFVLLGSVSKELDLCFYTNSRSRSARAMRRSEEWHSAALTLDQETDQAMFSDRIALQSLIIV